MPVWANINTNLDLKEALERDCTSFERISPIRPLAISHQTEAKRLDSSVRNAKRLVVQRTKRAGITVLPDIRHSKLPHGANLRLGSGGNRLTLA